MGTSSLAALAGMGLFAVLVAVVVGILVGALILSVAFRLIVGIMPSYLRALGAVVVSMVAVFVVGLIFGMVMRGGGGGLVSMIVNFLVGAAAVNYMLPAANGSQIGFGKACLVQLVYMVIGIVLALILGFIFAMAFGAALFGMH